ncbi:uncharacterized protein BCR38DRAFT_420374 [Pseudomassariella vexata]|uniref:Transcription factor domain-containing protein n=1 Tax=Pseudomassariella vexata TaxID=1141098 RepID=A0A1Y2EEA4_9PEZI|nr:uncharacterized protein BCR38DRAFT_420374 [Pseudomassariella vexata]ORY69902.1 hypothetical protein BCR38DRAFT_420374 [Pseudomassariella vexata]
MFRDESSKVIQKAHASWTSSPSSASSSGSSRSPHDSSTSTNLSWSRAEETKRKLQVIAANVPPKVQTNVEEIGIQFFMNRYLMTHPTAPEAPDHMALYSGGTVAMRNVMIAVGLAGLSNTQGNHDLKWVARQRYTAALKQTNQLIAAKRMDQSKIMVPLSAVVMLALFEVVQGKGSKLSTGDANIHIIGAMALLRGVLPLDSMPGFGARAVLQLMFSLYMSSHLSDSPLPPVFFDGLNSCKELIAPEEKCCCDIAVSIARYLQIHSDAKRTRRRDGSAAADKILQLLLDTDAVLARLEVQLHTPCPYIIVNAPDLPPAAVFRGKYHKYHDVWGARIWNHLRWGRILVCSDIINLSDEYPLSSFRTVTAAQRSQCFQVTERMAEDIITSTPSHWHHPILNQEQSEKFAAVGNGGSGAAGIPSLLWHLKIAACAPGVPRESWDWVYAMLQVVWKDMGMQHAHALSEMMEGHRVAEECEATERIVKVEEDEED